MRQLDICIVRDLHLNAERHTALLQLGFDLCVVIERRVFGMQFAKRADRAHLGHAPSVNDFDAVIVLIRAQHRFRDGRTAYCDALQGRKLQSVVADIVQQRQLNGRHAGDERHPVAFDQFVEIGAVELRPRHHQFRAAHRRNERDRPGVGVEHRRDRHHHVFSAAAEASVWLAIIACRMLERCE